MAQIRPHVVSGRGEIERRDEVAAGDRSSKRLSIRSSHVKERSALVRQEESRKDLPGLAWKKNHLCGSCSGGRAFEFVEGGSGAFFNHG